MQITFQEDQVGLRFCISNQLPGDAHAGPASTF